MKRTKEFRNNQQKKRKNKYRKVLLSLEKKLSEHLKSNHEDLEKRVSKMTITPKANKCQCCCNIRRSSWYTNKEKMTMQERRINYKDNYEVDSSS